MLPLFLILIAVDQLSKRLAVFLSTSSDITIVHNTGVAFGVFGKFPFMVIIITLALLTTIVLFRKHFFNPNKWHSLSLEFIFAGGLGNLIDRIFLGHVVDFIKLPLIPYFNLADVFINIGVLLYITGVFAKNDH